MKKLRIIVLILIGIIAPILHGQILDGKLVPETHKQAQAVKLALRVIPSPGSENRALDDLAQLVAKTLQITGQFAVDVACAEQPKSKKDIMCLLHEGYSLVIYMNQFACSSGEAQAIEWRLYDVADANQIVSHKFPLLGTTQYGWAYNLADAIWFELKQQQSSFASKIAYIKKKPTRYGAQQSIICVSNFDGSCEREVFSSTGTYVGLYWHTDTIKPTIFCSEFTRFKVRLDAINLAGKKKVVLNFDGTCVGISLAPTTGRTGNEAIYCLSGNIWKFNYSKSEHKSYHTCIIKNDGKNSTPTLLAGGDIIFCSDARSLKKQNPKARGPQICYYHGDTKDIELITQDGYCVGPAYTPVTHKIAYSKKVNGVMQLFVYDFKNKKHQQVTYDAGNKIDCSWSACGNYLVFCYQVGTTSRIAAMHIVLQERWYITPVGIQAYYPAWSPVYKIFPE